LVNEKRYSPLRRLGYLEYETLPSPKRPIHTGALAVLEYTNEP